MSDAEQESRKDEIWVEKYRPETFDDVVGQDDITNQLSTYVKENNLPNLMFAGPAGTGKTTSAVIIAKEIYGDDWKDNFLELNASDDRGIDVVRERIKEFARSSIRGYDHRLIFLDEADSLTNDAQSALRRTMEQFSSNIRFILSCNYSSQIIDPIQSRCSVYRFTPVNDESIGARLRDIANQQDVTVTDGGIDALVYASNGDMRRAVNSLQAAATAGDEVNEETVYMITATARPGEIRSMVEAALTGDYVDSRDQLTMLMFERGISGGDILDQLHRLIWEFDLSDEAVVEFADQIGEVDYRIRMGSDAQMQLQALLARLAKQN